MARYTFGGTASDFVEDDRGNRRAGVECTVWTAQTGGTQVTDLLDMSGAPITVVTSASSPKGMIQFQGPSGTGTVWVQTAGAAGRVKMFASDSLGAGGAGSGDMLAANNLSDLASAATARTNLGLGTAATTASTAYDASGAAAAAQAASQPLDSDLTAIAALTTTSFGRALLALADASALRTSAGLVLGTDVYSKTAADAAFQPLDSDLTAIAALTTTSTGRSLLAAADAAAIRTISAAAASTHTHAESDVTSLVADLALKATLASPTFTGTPAAPTAAQGTNTTQVATTAYAQTELALKLESFTFTVSGAVATAVGASRLYVEGNYTIVSVRASVGTAPTGATLICDVNKNGTTIYTTQGNRPAIAISGNTATANSPDVTTLASGDYLTVDVDQVGSTVAGSNLTVTVRVRRTS